MNKEQNPHLTGRSLEDIDVSIKSIVVVGSSRVDHTGYAAKTLQDRYPDATIKIIAGPDVRKALAGVLGDGVEWLAGFSGLIGKGREGPGKSSCDLAVFLSRNPDINDGGWRRLWMSRLNAKCYAAHYLEPDLPPNLFSPSNNLWLVFGRGQWRRDAMRAILTGATGWSSFFFMCLSLFKLRRRREDKLPGGDRI